MFGPRFVVINALSSFSIISLGKSKMSLSSCYVTSQCIQELLKALILKYIKMR